jgi:hypothetical protein
MTGPTHQMTVNETPPKAQPQQNETIMLQMKVKIL